MSTPSDRGGPPLPRPGPARPAHSVLDAAAIDRLHKLGGSALLGAMIDLFCKHGPERVEAAVNGCSRGDLEAVRRAAHSLRSTAANLGARRLAARAGQLEGQASNGNQEGCDELIGALPTDLKEALAQLQQVKETQQ